MKKVKWIVLSLLLGCGGSLTKEQQEEMKESLKSHEIKRVTEAQLLEEGLHTGREIAAWAGGLKESDRLDSIKTSSKATIRWVTTDSNEALAIEKQIIEAYLMNVVTGELPENIQLVGDDSLLYTKPVIHKLPDGAVEIQGMWSIMLSKKQLILSMED